MNINSLMSNDIHKKLYKIENVYRIYFTQIRYTHFEIIYLR